MAFRITSTVAEAAVVTGEGRLNAASSPAFRQQLDEAFDGGARSIIVEMSGVDFVDSTGLGALVSGLKRARLLGGDLRVVAPGAQATMVLGLSNLDRVLPAYPTVARAVAGLAA
jgi:anti-sigma B factor antagonist